VAGLKQWVGSGNPGKSNSSFYTTTATGKIWSLKVKTDDHQI
jgi:hypothetical protein